MFEFFIGGDEMILGKVPAIQLGHPFVTVELFTFGKNVEILLEDSMVTMGFQLRVVQNGDYEK